jgi:predicted HTH transcriptional regulator
MTSKINEIILYNSESYNLDFKREQYPIEANHLKKHELLKDILAMVNHPSDEDKYIIIGVSENGSTKEFHSITNFIDEASYRQYINSNIEPEISFEYKPILYEGHQLAIFRIYGNKNRPYLFKKDIEFGQIKAGDGFIRTGTSTKKIVRSDLETIYKTRYTELDRKSDLEITCYIKPFENSYFKNSLYKNIDISIENKSYKSIAFDVEMKIFKGEGYKLTSDYDLKKEFLEIEAAKEENSKMKENLSHVQYITPSDDCVIEYFEDYIIVKRIKVYKAKTAMDFQYLEKQNDIFFGNIKVMCQIESLVKAEVIIISDNFSTGILSQIFEIQILP